ncbi:MAG: hypothetical protein LBM93_14400 [Oscillospiraceae bacterium]|jgi:predicted nucleotide-binding protein|nr:hypothetical protein [Oscillospiraceae bacterium]
MKKEIFIISSSQGKNYANSLKKLLNTNIKLAEAEYETICWSDNVFKLSETTIQNLENKFQNLYENSGYTIALLTLFLKIIILSK